MNSSEDLNKEDSFQPELANSKEEPQVIQINEFRKKTLPELLAMAEELSLKAMPGIPKPQLVFELLSALSSRGVMLEGVGIMEQARENYAMLRDPDRSFRTSPDDLYIKGEFIRRHGLRVGYQIRARFRAPRHRENYLSVTEILSIEGIPVDEFQPPKDFEKLTPLFPKERLILDNADEKCLATRMIDLVAPLGKGQRGLIVAPPRGGKTILLKQIARAIRANYPKLDLIVLLLDERPEEVTDFEETIGIPVFASTFDEPSRRHAQVADLVIERAKRLVELGRDVVILLDSLTRLARGYNANQQGGKIMSGGLSSNALEKPRRFFGAARNVEEGGSLTVVATCLVETESRMDEVIFEEFKGTGNMELKLDRDLAERRIFPAIHLSQSGTRNDDRLYHPDELQRVLDIRRQLAQLATGESVEVLLKNLEKTQNNAEFLLRGLR